ncbi:MAG: DUF4295 domain-containing protein [Bacteroidota bacterium]
MAKKVVATLKTGEAAQYSKVIKMVKSPKTGAYSFKEEILHKDLIEEFFAKK